MAAHVFILASHVCPPQMMGDVFSALTAAVGAADKVLELIHRTPDIPKEGDLVPASFEGRIELKNVHFCYPTRPHSLVGHCLFAPMYQAAMTV